MATSPVPAITRRGFLKTSSGLAGASIFAALQGCKFNPNAVLVGGFQAAGSQYGVAAIDTRGNTLWQLNSPARVHGPAIDPDLRLGAVAARRPGDFVQVFSAETGTLLEQMPCPDGMIFEGHVELLANRLWATAALRGSCKAQLLSWDLARLSASPDVLPLPGIGPHQILRDANRLWLAIGGWQTDDRVVTNANDFESFLLEIDTHSLEIKNHGNPAPGLSLRHLGIRNDALYAGMQYAIPRPSDHPLVYQYANGSWSALGTPVLGWEAFDGYIASVAVNENQIMATSPQGHHLGLWDRNTLESIQVEKVLDVSAAINVGNQLKAASGVGVILDAENLSARIHTEFHWDNHWVSFVPA